MAEIRKRVNPETEEKLAEILVQNFTDAICGDEEETPLALFNLGFWDIVQGEYRMTGDTAKENLRRVGERNHE